jgi:hypothetical protein
VLPKPASASAHLLRVVTTNEIVQLIARISHRHDELPRSNWIGVVLLLGDKLEPNNTDKDENSLD